ncbi:MULTISPECIES: hypothetical protein [unclassified Natrinema]|uniref:hypothetical protein n=1 Tax=unclassified Natrinema TaxID=2622230 RepID=UPI00026D4790|nr:MULTISPECIES: hypothetical protein [unclassified Natrinema]AFO58416.1 hypothetical protein NJ7G_3196 [Natrinema sp. J7-2]
MSYVISANADGFNVGLWNDNDGNNGIASMFFYDYLGSRFYNDPGVPLAAGTRTSIGEYGYVYGFESFRGRKNNYRDQVGDPDSAIEAAD